MGVEGLLAFHNTWKYLEDWNFKSASIEMLDSKWAREDAPSRAKELSDIVNSALAIPRYNV